MESTLGVKNCGKSKDAARCKYSMVFIKRSVLLSVLVSIKSDVCGEPQYMDIKKI